MYLQNQNYSISASVEIKPPLDKFDFVYNPHNIDTSDIYMARTFNIASADKNTVSMALIDRICANYEPYATLEGNALTVILFDSIVRIALTTNQILQYTECDNMGGLHEIHTIENGYIIWGEREIFRYDRSLNRIWSFEGRDILVSLAANKHFWIDQGLIHCRDFLGYQYVLDFNGTTLQEFMEFEDPATK